MLPGTVRLCAVNPCCGEELLIRNNWELARKCQFAPLSLLVARAADYPTLAIHVDPDHPAVLDELEAGAVAVELWPEIVGAAHEWQNAPLELRERHRAALTDTLERPVRIARRIGQRRGAAEAGGKRGGKEKGAEHCHIRDSRGRLSTLTH